MTKILFLALWYCSIFPGAFFLCSFSLGIKYYVDRFCLMRNWKKAPALGGSLSMFSRRYFFTVAIAVMAIISSYYQSAFPFDNLCANESINSTYTEGRFFYAYPAGRRKRNHSQFLCKYIVVFVDCNCVRMVVSNIFVLSSLRFYRRMTLTIDFVIRILWRPGSGFTFPFVPSSTSENTNPEEWSKYSFDIPSLSEVQRRV